MPNYVRSTQEGGCYFFTVVTYQRRPFLINPDARLALRQSIADTRSTYPFNIDAWVLLPDHMHCIWTLPRGDVAYSKRWGLIKAGTSRRLNEAGFSFDHQAISSAANKRESGFWQRRFWEHLIQDQTDLQKHLDYIHFNPTKHGLVDQPKDWPYSSFHRYVNEGYYPEDWGVGNEGEGEFGE